MIKLHFHSLTPTISRRARELNVALPPRCSIFRYGSRWRNLRYHFRNAPWDDLHAYERQRSGRGILPWGDLILSSWRHGASFEDYYLMRFFEKSREERREYLTTSLYYELERQKNRLERAVILRDKARFILHFHDLLGRQAWSWEALLRQEITSPPPQRLVIKNRWGVKGHDIHFPATRFADWAAVRSYIQSHLAPPEHYICEEYVDQHPDLSDLNPGTLNTLRIMTWQEAGEVAIWGTILRVGRGSGPDNWACGGLGTWVDEAGTLVGPSVPKNPFLVKVDRHPDSGRPIKGRRVPDIEAARRLAVESALRLPEVQSVGWDIAIGVRGPCLIEGNDRWSHQLWQCVLDQGRREMANRVCDMYQVYE